MAGKRGAGTKKELRSLPQALSPAQNMAGGKKKNPPQKGDESYAERFDARYDDSPEVRALPPSLLTEWRANREALEGQNQLKLPNRLQNGLSSRQRTGLWFCRHAERFAAQRRWVAGPRRRRCLARQEPSHKKKPWQHKKNRWSNRGAESQLEAFGSVPGPMRHPLVHWRVRTAGEWDPIPMSGWWFSGSPGFTAPQRVPPMFHTHDGFKSLWPAAMANLL